MTSESTPAKPKRLTKGERQAVWARFEGRCAYCGCRLAERRRMDHLKPVRRRTRRPGEQPVVFHFERISVPAEAAA